MIERSRFFAAWKQLCARFGRDNDADQAAAYYEYLSPQMDGDQFAAAARAIWATSKWFPRPADFVMLSAGGDWRLVLDAIDACHPPEYAWGETFHKMTERGQAACRRLGGIPAMRAIWEKDILRLKKAWEEAYEQEAVEAVLSLPLPTSTKTPALPGPGS